MNPVDASSNRLYAVVDAADNSTTVYNDPCKLWSVKVITDTSAHTIDINDGSTTILTIPASQTAPTEIDFHGVKVDSLVIDPDDSATGAVLVIYEPIDPNTK